MTVILKDGTIHISDPDQEYTTYCGMTYSTSSLEYSVTGAMYIEDQLARMRDEYPDADVCEECSASLTFD